MDQFMIGLMALTVLAIAGLAILEGVEASRLNRDDKC